MSDRQSQLMIYARPAWFELLDRLGIVQSWLRSSNEAVVDNAVVFLSSVQSKFSDRVSELVTPFIGAGERWKKRLVYLVQWSDPGASRDSLELFLRLIDNGVLDDAVGPITANADFWELLRDLDTKEPAWACEVIGHYLRRRLRLADEVGLANPFEGAPPPIPNSQHDDRIFLNCAAAASAAFVAEVLPFMLQVMERTATHEGRPIQDPVWWPRSWGNHWSIRDALLNSAEKALYILASTDPEQFRNAESLLRSQPYETAQYLLLRAYSAGGESLADPAVEYLIEDPGRFNIDYSDGALRRSSELLQAVTPHCSDRVMARLESVLLELWPACEQRPGYPNYRGYTQCVLLDSVDAGRLSSTATRRLAELHRKFPEASVPQPQATMASFVGPPISPDAATHMTDAQWIEAIRTYNTAFCGVSAGGELIGGASQLAHVLQEETARHPGRFTLLVERLPDDAHSDYFDAVVRGVAEAGANPKLLLQVCRRLHRLPGRPCGMEISRAIRSLRSIGACSELLDILAWYGIEDPGPGDALPDAPEWNILTQGLNCVRGSVASTIAELLFADPANGASLIPVIEKMLSDPSLAVRAMVAEAVTALLNVDRDLAIRFFGRLTTGDDELLAIDTAFRFMAYAGQTHYEQVEPLLVRMLDSPVPNVSVAGARLACNLACFESRAEPHVRRSLDGSAAQRSAAAALFAEAVWAVPAGGIAELALIALFRDSDAEVRKQAADAFRHAGGRIAERPLLIQAFIDSPEFGQQPGFFFHDLLQSTMLLPDVCCEACERALSARSTADQPFNSRTREVSNLLIRVYTQTTDLNTQRRCLDLIDRLVEEGDYDAVAALDLLDR